MDAKRQRSGRADKGGSHVDADQGRHGGDRGRALPRRCLVRRRQDSGDRRGARRARRDRGRRCGRGAGHAGRHRPPHPHAAPLHGYRDRRQLLHRPRRRPLRRDHHDHRLRHPRAGPAADGRLPHLAAARGEGAVRLLLPRRHHQLERRDPRGHGDADPRSRGQQLQALHGLQGRDHARRGEDDAQLRAGAGPRRALHRPLRGRQPRLVDAAGAAEGRRHRAGGAPAVAPAGGGRRGHQPRDPHRPAPQGADLHRPRHLPRGAGGDHPRPPRRAARLRRVPGAAPRDRRERLLRPRPGGTPAAT